MRLPFPEHIPIRYALAFAALLCSVQLFQGTSPLFSLCCFLYILIAAFTFNLAGGFTSCSGGYIFFYAVLAVILGLFWKTVLGEPGDSNLFRPLLTIEATLGGITAMLGAVFLSRKLTAGRALLANLVTDANMYSAAVGCMIVGLALTFVLSVIPYEGGSLLSALSQLNRFLPIAMILAVIYQIRKTHGASSMNMVAWVSGIAMFASGIFVFSKQGIFTPPLCWLVAAASQRYKLSLYQILGFTLMMSFITYYLVPYSQYGRNYQTTSLTESKSDAFEANIETSISLLSDLGYVRQQYEQSTTTAERNEAAPAYYDTPQGLLGRLQMISMDDAIINVTEQNGPFGFTPIIMDFQNLIPHFLWPNKPTLGFGNLYAHEIGMIAEENTVTGISFSPIGEAFHLGRWVGIFLVAPLLWIMLFVLFDSLCGDARKSPWGLLVIVLFAHIGPEGGLGGPIYMLWYGAAGIIFAALAAAYFMPILGSIFTGPGRTGGLRRTGPIRSIPRRLPSVQASRSSGQ